MSADHLDHIHSHTRASEPDVGGDLAVIDLTAAAGLDHVEHPFAAAEGVLGTAA